ncbi:Carboxypeptidase C (cathepsin A) [Arenibacter palladensis]|uniref:Carboxypeptidase C (Cathepsin A) n=1 Tax=Arenibacter palladensis TaxID=237373 RepID=A0A1M5AST3_9FLAO|nr:carboxypeptidase [Arenibacter palladensis]SHF33293.1 Carboxypeptidase C (cathepsin A) [Arenibacter palladensis]|tara:strand:+ start:8868 stop:10373 length:1506 start_codon:yes stop_codon:yes gene_type:complete
MKAFILITTLLLGQFCYPNKENDSIPKAEVATTMQSVTINGNTIYLTAKAGTFEVKDETNKPIALMGFTYYTRDSKRGLATQRRPIVFAFNGGPGSSSFWLHMGILGPKRIVVDDPKSTPAAPYKIVNNNYSILDVADLVMIDPVGTGLSIPIGKAKFKDFWGVDQDIRSLSLFITQFLIHNDRMNSPKFLLGESYGTFRNAGLMNTLLNQGVAMNGVIMVSAVFDLRTLLFPPNDDLPYIVHFPTYAATAWYHDKITDKQENVFEFLKTVRSFTENEYTPALFKGDQISENEKANIASKLAYYTGTDTDYWLKADLKVTASEFFAEFLRDKGEIVGRLDSRFTGINEDLLAQEGSHDPQSMAISPAYISGFLDYFYGDLKVNKNLLYSITAGRRDGFKWDWTHKGNTRWGTSAAINTGIDMATALSRDPNMKVLILNGIYDLATVFYGVEHSINHLGLKKEIKDNITMEYYEAGHMMYTHKPSMEKFRKDVSSFILNTSK